jgi:hypothetical protein
MRRAVLLLISKKTSLKFLKIGMEFFDWVQQNVNDDSFVKLTLASTPELSCRHDNIIQLVIAAKVHYYREGEKRGWKEIEQQRKMMLICV